MNPTQKLLKKISRSDKERILEVMIKAKNGELRGIKLSNKNQYRIRVGNYRIKYSVYDGRQIIDEVRRRDKNTYK